MCCSLCDCLGFCSSFPKDHTTNDSGQLVSLIVNRNQHDFVASAQVGCQYCNLVSQAYKLLKFDHSDPQIDIRIYKNHPTEIAPSKGKDTPAVEIFACTDSYGTQLPRFGREVPERSDSQESFLFLEKCYKICLQDHQKCRYTSSTLPKRVIDVSANTYRLIEPVFGTSGAYAALSYIWGGWRKFNTKGIFQQLKKGIDPNSMPIVFQEVAIVAQRLGIQYLWIDAVCIIQDDVQDWNQEAAKMADIFQHASIVIAAASVPNPGIPFLGPRVTPAPPSIPLDFHGTSGVFRAREQLACGLHTDTSSKSKDLLDHRGWALQERELACRWVSYSASEIQWKCKTLQACECCAANSPSQAILSNSKNSSEELHCIWHFIVQEYTSRKLTNQNDKLPAIMGLAKVFKMLTRATYFAGLWKENFVDDMVWKLDVATKFHPLALYLAPTFSWASILGGVSYQPARSLYKGTRTYHSKILDIQVFTTRDESFPMAKAGWIVLRGPVMDATLSTSKAIDPGAYHLIVGEQRYPSNVHFGHDEIHSGCEFTIDSLLTVQNIGNENTGGNKSMNVHRAEYYEDVFDSFKATSVKLLGLYVLVLCTRAVVYENFLILGRDPKHKLAYQRIGLGTGKVYPLATHQGSSKLDNPFLWASKDMGYHKAETGNYLVEDIRIV